MKELIMAKCTIALKGNLGKDVEAKVSKAGKPYSVLAVASTPSKKNEAGEWENGETMWFNATIFGELNPFEFVKGAAVEIDGTFVARTYQKKDGSTGHSLDVTGDRAMVVAKPKSVSEASQTAQDNWKAPTPMLPLADDLPF